MSHKHQIWMTPFTINSIKDLEVLINALCIAINEDVLIQVFPDNTPFGIKDEICKFVDRNFWPDYIEGYFQNRQTGVRYKLSVETYHGTGGNWEIES